MARRQRVEENDDPGPRHPKASRLTDTSPRPKRSNRGQGGVVARLVATAAQIRPDLEPQLAKQCKNTVTPADTSVNVMAPAKKSRARVVTPTRNDPPLSLDTLKPSLLQGGPGSTFGFARVDPTDKVGARGDADVDDREVAPHAMEDGPEPNAEMRCEPDLRGSVQRRDPGRTGSGRWPRVSVSPQRERPHALIFGHCGFRPLLYFYLVSPLLHSSIAIASRTPSRIKREHAEPRITKATQHMYPTLLPRSRLIALLLCLNSFSTPFP
ncbi:hypothetical protein EDB85DRAFT_2155100 [Lactarius pseudohatsudake]|nr:hypothetical protein EDB85DRAFT_2155100 [Lactarius pseudohatsudake]